jgi:hypothetical protein
MNDRIRALTDELVSDMAHYMKYGGAESEADPDYDPDFDAGYTQKHIDQCGKILGAFFDDLSRVPQENKDKAILSSVRTTVLALNKLNDDCGGGLIETDQREQLCEIIISGARDAGLVSPQYDITEEWREW